MREALDWVIVGLHMICNPRPSASVLTFLKCSFFSGVESFANFSNLVPQTIGNKDKKLFFFFIIFTMFYPHFQLWKTSKDTNHNKYEIYHNKYLRYV